MYRGDYGGGGGSSSYDRRGDRGRKRSYEPEGDYNGSYDHHGGGNKRARHQNDGRGYQRSRNNHGGGGYRDRERRDRFGPSMPAESDQARAWRLAKKNLIELGDHVTEQDATALREHLQEVATLLSVEIDAKETRGNDVQSLVLQCAARMPHKTSLYAVLTALLNEKQKIVGQQLLHATMAMVQKDLDFFQTERAAELREQEDNDVFRRDSNVAAIALRMKLLLRYMGELVSVRIGRAEDVLAVLDTLQSVCTPDDFTMESDELLRARQNAAAFKDFFASLVLDTLLYCGQSLMISCEDLYDSLLSRCKDYVMNREEESNPGGLELDHSTSWMLRRLRLEMLWEPENGEELHALCKKIDPLLLTWNAVNEIRAQPLPTDPHHARWKIPGTIYPQALFADAFRKTEPCVLTASFVIDSSTFDVSKAPPYNSLFRVLDEDSGAAGAAISKLPISSYLVIRCTVQDMIEVFHPKPSLAAKHLLSLCRSINGRIELSQEGSNDSSVKSEYLLVETLLVLMLNDVERRHSAYYCSLLYHLVKTDAKAISPAIAIMVELLFREVPVMNAGATAAFVQLFSHFLSNFEFKWPWSHWSYVLEAQEDDPQRLFVSAVIERCVRLSYLQHLQSVLPSEFHMLTPPAPVPMIKYKGDDAPAVDGKTAVTEALRNFYEAAQTKVKAHPPASALQAWIEEELVSSGLDRMLALEVFWNTILDNGAATFTHIRLLLEKYREIVITESTFGAGEEKQLVLVKSVGAVWLKSPQHIGLILHMMLRMGIIDALIIAKWVFTSDAIQQYSWPYVWEILNETVAFTSTTIQAKKQLVEDAARKKNANSEDVEMDPVDLEDSLKRSEEDLEQILRTLFEGFNRVISEHKSNCDTEGVSYKDNWFHSALSQMKAFGSRFRVPLSDVMDELQSTVFNSSVADHDAKKVFQLLCDSFRSG